ncbi:ABC transporter substrate-binding protein [Flavisphingomonas formosensis]|uniref:ABC transporter substrate-binding protein n=1 Tax=Flavisphingomonas formosensis TaxID=861534 RepID=UPI0012F898FE|nr:ABC transporter substrate-binding protein [Sphingomonas formosensis]
MSTLASPAAAVLTRRETLRRIGLAGLATATAGGVATLWTRAAMDMRARERLHAGRPVSHQLGWLKGVQFGGDFMAEEQGYFRREGLDVTLAAGGVSTDYRTLVASGSSLISESNVIGMINSQLQKQPLIAFAAILQRDPSCIASLARNPITSLADMVGKTICLPNSVRGQLSALMRRQGLDPDRVRFVPGGTDPSILMAGQVDGYYDWATRLKPALDQAGVGGHFLHFSDIGAPGYGELLFARRDRLEADFDLFVRYVRALIGGWSWMNAHPVETARIVCDKYAAPGTDLARQTAEAKLMRDYVVNGDGTTRGLLWVQPEPFEHAIRLAYDSGDIPRGTPIDPGRFVTSAVVEAAHRPVSRP